LGHLTPWGGESLDLYTGTVHLHTVDCSVPVAPGLNMEVVRSYHSEPYFNDFVSHRHYANNNPYVYQDPEGQFAFLIPLINFVVRAVSVAIIAYDTYNAYQTDGVAGAVEEGAYSAASSVVPGGKAAMVPFKKVGKSALNRAVSKIDDITKPGSKLLNIKTDVPRSEFEKNLLNSGFAKSTSKDGNVNIWINGNKKYTIRDFSKSTDGPTAEVFKNNKPTSKIRLGDE
jgi:hypothetical protein